MKLKRWRQYTRDLHRDLGYLTVGLTLIYALSGLAVNHMADWNPNLIESHERRRFSPIQGEGDAAAAALQTALQLPAPTERFWPAPGRLNLFYEGMTIEAAPAEGWAVIERQRRRPLLSRLNFLHLNHPKRWWTLVADVYAVSLAFLAVSGAVILRGKKGLSGRGKWLIALGSLAPIAALLLLD